MQESDAAVSARMTTAELAKRVLEVLDFQQAYFRSRDMSVLNECRQREGQLRHICKLVLDEHINGLKLDLS